MKNSKHTGENSVNTRIEVVDALRGFAVIAILLVHSVEHFIYPVYPDIEQQAAWLTILDKGTFTITFGLFAGKAYAIFALLFGFTFHMQFSNQQKKGFDFGWRFIWRLSLLTFFASLNAAFFPGGDVLLLFVAVGSILVLVRHWKDKNILILSLIFLSQPIEWFHFIMSLTDSGYSLPDLGISPLYGEVISKTKAGEWLPFLKANLGVGQKASFFWALGSGRFMQTAGLFLLGLWIGRKELFELSKEKVDLWIKVLMIASIIFAPLYMFKVQWYDNATAPLTKGTIGVVFDMWQKLAFTFVLVASFVLVYRNETFRNKSKNLTYYGKMSLTNYISQSLIGALIFFPMGLNLAPYSGYTLSFLIGLIIYFFQVRFCKWWLKRNSHGPLEYLWKKATWIGR